MEPYNRRAASELRACDTFAPLCVEMPWVQVNDYNVQSRCWKLSTISVIDTEVMEEKWPDIPGAMSNITFFRSSGRSQSAPSTLAVLKINELIMQYTYHHPDRHSSCRTPPSHPLHTAEPCTIALRLPLLVHQILAALLIIYLLTEHHFSLL